MTLHITAKRSDTPEYPVIPDEDSPHTEDHFQQLLHQLAAEYSQMADELTQLRLENTKLQQNAKEFNASERKGCRTQSRTRSFGPMNLPGIVSIDEKDEVAPACTQTLPPNGVQIKSIWLKAVETGRVEAAMRISEKKTSGTSFEEMLRRENGNYNGMLRHFISYPSSPPRMVWDFLGAALIFYDLFAIPLIFSFYLPESNLANALNWITLIFWTLDVVASLFVGYVKDGITHMDPKSIMVQYAKTWLILDLMVVIPDWAFTFASMGKESMGKESSSVRLLRIVRLVRMVRLLRLLKLRKLIQNLNELIDSEYVGIFANIGKMILILLVINHYICCAWFLVGSLEASPTTWVKEHGIDDVDWTYQYFTSFHWAITQFTPASMHVQPQNVGERIFALCVVIFALVGFSYVVGSITGSLTQLRSMQENMSKQFWNLRCYLKQNRVSIALSARVQRYLEHAWLTQKETVSTDKIPIFKMLSEQLHSELQCEIYVPQVSVHPLFNHLSDWSHVTMGRLANKAIIRKVLARNDSLFIPGENATHTSFVRTGKLQYTKLNSNSKESQEWVDNMEDWIAEQVLWMSAWAHLGHLTAMQECELLLVDPAQFGEIIHLNPPAFQLVSQYARNFVEWIADLEDDMLSDIWQGEDVGPRVRRLMGLEEEITKGTSSAWAVSWGPQLSGRSKQGSLLLSQS